MPVRSLPSKGFTLIELMIVVVIIAIIAGIAIPAYDGYIVRSNRAAAQAQMLVIADLQEEYRFNNRTYVDYSTLSSSYTLPTNVGENYTPTIISAATSTFTITFTPKAGSTQENDGTLTLDNLGNKTPGDKW